MNDHLRDYLYVDNKRLDSYVNQITSPVAYDKVPLWKVGLGLGGPSVEGQQQRPSRERTAEEEIPILLNHLRKKRQLATERISSTTYYGKNDAVLRLEECEAVRLRVPAIGKMKSDAILWISEGDQNSGRLIILQNDGKNDDEEDYGAHSAYSTLLNLYQQGISLSLAEDEDVVQELKAQTRRRLVRDIEQSPIKSFYTFPGRSKMINSELVDAEVEKIVENHPRLKNPIDEDWKKRFAKDPVEALSRLGARVETSMRIETLYRVRTVYIEEGASFQKPLVVTFGYPVFVSAQ